MQHPLLAHFHRAADGRFPAADGGVTVLPPLADGTNAVIAFTGHAMIATDLPAAVVAGLGADGFGAANAPGVLLRLARGGNIDVIDMTLVAAGRGGGALPCVTDLDEHPRVQYARQRRSDVAVHGDARGLVTISSGLAGRREVSIELHDGAPPASGRALIREALALVEPGQHVFAAVSPGNARSIRAFLACGFVPIGSEVLITPGHLSG